MGRRTEISRRGFFGLVGAAGSSSFISSGLASFDQTESFDAEIEGVEPWTIGLGRFRCAFDINGFRTEPGIYGVSRVMDAYNTSLSVPDKTLGIIVVVRHIAVPMVLNTTAWSDFGIRSMLDRTLPTGIGNSENNFASEILKLQQRGARILACGSALAEFAKEISRRRRLLLLSVKKELNDALLGNTAVVPNGLYALARAQNVGCGVIG